MNFRTDFLLSIRHLLSDRINSAINIAGLILGLGVVTVTLVFVLNEFGYNRSFAKKDRIYRVIDTSTLENKQANTPFILAPTLKQQFNEVEGYMHHFKSDFEIKQENGEYIQEKELLFAESDFFNMFDVQLTEGSLDGFDEAHGQIIIGRELANKYFGNRNPTGEIFTVRLASGKEYPMTVAGVFNHLPANSTMRASAIVNGEMGLEVLTNMIISTAGNMTPDDVRNSWHYSLSNSYLLLREGTDAALLTEKINRFAQTVSDDDEDGSSKHSYMLQPLTNIYFNRENVSNSMVETGNLSMVYILISVGIAILLIACINYMNLTSAQAISQTKNLAIRRIFGASRSNLVSQTVFESLLVAFIALPFAGLLAQLLLPFAGSLLGKTEQLSFAGNLVPCLTGIVAITIFTGLFSGLFVSLRTTSFNLIDVLKRKAVPFARNPKVSSQKVMVVFQIAVFIVLLSSVFVMRKQTGYAFTANLGFKKEGLVRIPVKDVNYDVFRQELLKNASVQSVTGAMFIPPQNFFMTLTLPKVDEPDKMVKVNAIFVDYGFVETMGIELTSGENFNRNGRNSGVIVNRQAIETLGMSSVIGEQTAFGEVIGTVSDFNIYPIYESIPPLLIVLNPSMTREIAVRIGLNNVPQTIEAIQQAWQASGATLPFSFSFTDDVLQQIYGKDVRFAKLAGLLALIAIFIAGMGLFGLSLLTTKQKIKETGIRRICGATVTEIIYLLSSGFVGQVVAAFAVAAPVAWFVMQKWLQSFAYQTEISFLIFLLAGIIALAVTLLTVGCQSWRAATKNPAEALKYE